MISARLSDPQERSIHRQRIRAPKRTLVRKKSAPTAKSYSVQDRHSQKEALQQEPDLAAGWTNLGTLLLKDQSIQCIIRIPAQ
jgi:hypothetical protein